MPTNADNKTVRLLLYCCRIRFRRYPAFYFPVFVFLQVLQKLSYNLKLRCVYFRVQPMPNLLFEQYQHGKLVQSEHTLFVGRTVFNQYVVEREINWINLVVRTVGVGGTGNVQRNTDGDNGLTSMILNRQPVSVLFQVMPLEGNVPVAPNVIYVKENLYYELAERYKLGINGFGGMLQRLPEQQHLPQVASKANVFVYNTPYDMSTDMMDFIMGKYFETPRLLYRNHTYQIALNEQFLGNTFYTKNFAIFAHLRSLYFKCLNLESTGNSFELYGIVCKSLTSLHQTTTFNNFVPRQRLEDSFHLPICPFGLGKYHNELTASLTAYLKQESNALIDNEIYPVFMLKGERGIGKSSVLRSVAQSLGIQIFYADCSDIMTSISSQTESKLVSALNRSKLCEPLIIALHNFEIFGIDNEGHEDLRILATFQAELHTLFSRKYSYPVVIIALANEKNSEKHRLNSLFLDVIGFQSPTAEERYQLLRWIAARDDPKNMLPLAQLKKIAEQTQGFIFGDLKLLHVKALQLVASERLNYDHFEKALEEMQVSFSDSLGAPKVPKVLWSEIGGLAKLKTEIQNSIGLPLRHKKLMGKNLRRSGILLYGPPGTGKTLIAKAVATECNLSFLSVQGPELLNMYVGQSERNVREVFSRARSAAPCVLFLDELDSLAPNRGVSGDSGGVMDRVVSQMLSEMDGICKGTDPSQQIFVLAATNRPDLIDPALLRPGRFDKLLYVGPSVTIEDKESVLQAITNRFHLANDLTLRKIAEGLKLDMTGADLYSICSNAWLSAVRRAIRRASKDENSDDGIGPEHVIVNESDFKAAMKKFIPSINPADMEYFTRLRTNYSV
ncbi:peroxisomal ATPase PEX6 [Wyeomyia smithii]|uniref:peroxisomal ATPase PEX6 n=1 Tax=Wyeomyia smithii TaxID=174621 RepID=UPI002467ED09|nr:peroxisomal ATPase PEX6 [Wyeomyia smithii]XP_055541681.1 peroxisomal ATPase PEX6 [Wyeomyia smithii]